MFIVNKSKDIQRTVVKGNKQDVKPWEIVDVLESEAEYVTKAYWNIFGLSKEAQNKVIKKVEKIKKVIK